MTDETQDNGRKLFADIQPTDELTKHEVGMIEAEVRKEIDRNRPLGAALRALG